eukprot:354727-Chlamydomonas_euryale.AAC.5
MTALSADEILCSASGGGGGGGGVHKQPAAQSEVAPGCATACASSGGPHRRSIKRRSVEAAKACGGGDLDAASHERDHDTVANATAGGDSPWAGRFRRRGKAILQLRGFGAAAGGGSGSVPSDGLHTRFRQWRHCSPGAPAPHLGDGGSAYLRSRSAAFPAGRTCVPPRCASAGLPPHESDREADDAFAARDQRDLSTAFHANAAALRGSSDSAACSPPPAAATEHAAAALAAATPCDFRISTVLSGGGDGGVAGELEGSSDKLARRNEHMRAAAAGGAGTPGGASGSCCLIHLSTCLDDEPAECDGAVGASKAPRPRENSARCANCRELGASALSAMCHRGSGGGGACGCRCMRDASPALSPRAFGEFLELGPLVAPSPMHGFATRLALHSDDDFMTPQQSPGAPGGARGEPPLSALCGSGGYLLRDGGASGGGWLARGEGVDDQCAERGAPPDSLTSLAEFNAQLAAAAARGNRARADALWCALLRARVPPDMRTLNLMLRCLANSLARPDEAECMAREVCLAGDLSPNAVTYNLLAETRFRYEQLCHH